MKPLYKSEFVSSYWCEDRSLIYHEIRDISFDDVELNSIQNKLSEVYLHLKTNDIKFHQIYHPSKNINFRVSHMKTVTNFARFLKSQDEVIDEHCKGVSVIHTNGYVIKTINYFIKLFENKIPVKVVKNEEDAYKFLNLKKELS